MYMYICTYANRGLPSRRGARLSKQPLRLFTGVVVGIWGGLFNFLGSRQPLTFVHYFAMLLCCCENAKEEEITIIRKAKTADKVDADGMSMLQEKEVAIVSIADTDGFKEAEHKVIPLTGRFVISIPKKSNKLGFSVDTLLDDYCIVREVEQGSILSDAKPYDRLLTVNGTSASAQKLAELISDSASLELVFQRPFIKEVTLPKKGKQKAGFNIDTELATFGLVIKSLVDGAAGDLPAETFKPMDRITAVDGEEAPPTDLIKMLSQRDSPILRVCSYA